MASKKNNGAIWATLGLGILVIGLVLASGESGLFQGLFYVNPNSPVNVEIAQEISTEVPKDSVEKAVMIETDNPNSIKQNELSEQNLAVFGFQPLPGEDSFKIDRLVVNVAGTNVIPSDISAKLYLAYTPVCKDLERSECDLEPAPVAEFASVKVLENPDSNGDRIFELKATNPVEIMQNDWRYENLGRAYYLAIYGTVLPQTGSNSEQVGAVVTSLKYMNDSVSPFGVSGLPSDYVSVNVY